MLSLPDEWAWSLKGLAQLHTDRIDSVRTSVNHLIEFGYVVRSQNKNEDGTFGDIVYVVYSNPFDNPDFIPSEEMKYRMTPEEVACFENHENEDDPPGLEYPITEGCEPWLENPITVEKQPELENPTPVPCVENPISDVPMPEEPMQLNNNLINKKPINDEEEEKLSLGINVAILEAKVENYYMEALLRPEVVKKDAEEMGLAWKAMMNTAASIQKPEIIDAVNKCTPEQAAHLWERVYSELYSTKGRTKPMRKIYDKRSYIEVMMQNELLLTEGMDPWERSLRG